MPARQISSTRPLSLMPLLHSGRVRHLFPTVPGSYYKIFPALRLTYASLEQLRNGVAFHLCSDGSLFLPGTTMALGPFRRLLATPYRQTPVPMSVLQYLKSPHIQLFVSDGQTLRCASFFMIRHHLC
jgi:hypothetical protein